MVSDIINIYPFEDGNGRIYRLILSHVLMQIGCSFSPILLSFYHKRGRSHYIRAVNKFECATSMLYTMIGHSVVNGWINFE